MPANTCRHWGVMVNVARVCGDQITFNLKRNVSEFHSWTVRGIHCNEPLVWNTRFLDNFFCWCQQTAFCAIWLDCTSTANTSLLPFINQLHWTEKSIYKHFSWDAWWQFWWDSTLCLCQTASTLYCVKLKPCLIAELHLALWSLYICLSLRQTKPALLAFGRTLI